MYTGICNKPHSQLFSIPINQENQKETQILHLNIDFLQISEHMLKKQHASNEESNFGKTWAMLLWQQELLAEPSSMDITLVNRQKYSATLKNQHILL